MEMKTRIFLKTTVALLCVMFMAACSPETKLISALALMNQQYPQEIGSGLTITEVEYSGNYVTYFYQGDDTMYQFSQDLVTQELKQQLISALQQQAMTDTNVNEFMQTLRDAQVGIIYHYFTSSSVMDVVIEYSEL